jgi:hypothetical protein
MMTTAEKLEKRLAQYPSRLVSIVVLVDKDGRIVLWAIKDKDEIELLEVIKSPEI